MFIEAVCKQWKLICEQDICNFAFQFYKKKKKEKNILKRLELYFYYLSVKFLVSVAEYLTTCSVLRPNVPTYTTPLKYVLF